MSSTVTYGALLLAASIVPAAAAAGFVVYLWRKRTLTSKDDAIKATEGELPSLQQLQQYSVGPTLTELNSLDRLTNPSLIDELQSQRTMYEGLIARAQQRYVKNDAAMNSRLDPTERRQLEEKLGQHQLEIGELQARLEAADQLTRSVQILSTPPSSKELRAALDAVARWRDFRTVTGRRPLHEFIRSRPVADAVAIIAAMRDVQVGGLTAARKLPGNLFEVKVVGSHGRYGIIFSREGDKVLLALEAYADDTRATRTQARRRAEHRLRDWRSRP